MGRRTAESVDCKMLRRERLKQNNGRRRFVALRFVLMVLAGAAPGFFGGCGAAWLRAEVLPGLAGQAGGLGALACLIAQVPFGLIGPAPGVCAALVWLALTMSYCIESCRLEHPVKM